MKKTLISMMAVAAAMLMSSCTKEAQLGEVAGNGENVTVSFSISLEGNVGTRADVTTNGTALFCDKLVYEVYDKNGTKISKLSGIIEPAFADHRNQEVKFTLTKGQTYSFAFWAQDASCSAYTTADLQNIVVSYEGVKNNDETRDAFFGNTQPIMVTGNFDETVVLKRPFAQLNLAVSDIEAASDAGITVDQVKVVVNDLATTLNARTGKVGGPAQNVLFDLADILYKYPAAGTDTENQMLHLENPLTIDGVAGSEYPWMSMNYLLVNDATTGYASDNADITFTLTTTDALSTVETPDAKSDIVLISSNTPLQRNWRTNIIARLTSVGTFNVVIDPAFDGEYDRFIDMNGGATDYEVVYGLTATSEGYDVAAPAALNWIAEQVLAAPASMAGKTVKLTGDVDFSNNDFTSIKPWCPGKPMVFDGNGYTIKGLKSPLFGQGCTANISNVTIEDAYIEVTGNHIGALAGNLYGNIENCHVKNSSISSNGWNIAGLVGIHNSGNMTNCSATNVKIKAAFRLGALVGFHNETADRTYKDCTVTGAELEHTRTYGPDYYSQIGSIVGCVQTGMNLTLDNCKATDCVYKEVVDGETKILNIGDENGPQHELYGISESPVTIK